MTRKKLDLKATRAVLHDWGNLARTGDVGELLHGFPTRNVIDKMRAFGCASGGGTDGLTPPELAVARLRDDQSMAVRADVLIGELPMIRRWCVVAHYRDQFDTETVAEQLGCGTTSVIEQRKAGEEAICTGLNALLFALPTAA